MNSLYAKFVKETVNWDTMEDSESFVTYQIFQKPSCLKVIEMYVLPEARGKAKWNDLMNKIEEEARLNNCKLISAQISKSTSEFTQQRTAHLCRLFGMEKTFEDMYQIIYSRGVRYE